MRGIPTLYRWTCAVCFLGVTIIIASYTISDSNKVAIVDYFPKRSADVGKRRDLIITSVVSTVMPKNLQSGKTKKVSGVDGPSLKNNRKSVHDEPVKIANAQNVDFPSIRSTTLRRIVAGVDSMLSPYLEMLDDIRHDHLKNLKKSKQEAIQSTSDVIDSDSAEFFAQIESIPQMQTITVTVSVIELFQKLPWEGYEYSGNDCELIEAKSEYGNNATSYNAGFANRYYKEWCRKNVTSLLEPIPFERSILDIGYTPFLKPAVQDGGNSARLTYLHIIPNAAVNLDGDVYFGKYKLCPQRCLANKSPAGKPPEAELSKYEEVFTIAQFWGMGYFHFMNEELPRLSAWLPFLQKHPGIKIHVHSLHSFISTTIQGLGLDPGRLIAGNVHGKLLYSPAGTPCGAQTFFNTKLLSLRLQENAFSQPPDKLTNNHDKNTTGSSKNKQIAASDMAGNSNSSRKFIVMIRRSVKRFFNFHDEIFAELVKLSNAYGLQVKLFDDRRLPKYKDTIAMFHGAVAIVAPHGAGLSNMFYSQPGTVIIEGLCYNNKVGNLCYRNLAKLIGMRYYGVLLKEDCFQMKPNHLIPPLKQFLDLTLQKKS